jgi:membrane protein
MVLAGRRYREDHGGDRAGALAFATLLSLVPLLLLALAAFGAAGLDPSILDAVRRWLLGNFVPDTARGIEETITRSLDALAGNRRLFGAAGLAALVFTGWKLLATLQRSFEQIGGARDFGSRLLRVLGFWITVLLAPFLVAASLFLSGLLETLATRGYLPTDGMLVTKVLLPLAPGWAAVLLVYRLCIGKKVAWRAAILAATVTAACGEVLKVGFAVYVRQAFLTKTVLSGMGVMPLFLVWLYLSWVVFLLGAELCFVVHDYEGALRRCGLEPAGPPGPAVSAPAAPGGPPPGP